MSQEKYRSHLHLSFFIFVKLIPLFKMHIDINKNGRPSFALTFHNAISGQTEINFIER